MMACDSDEGPSSHGGPFKRPIDFEDGDPLSVKKARLSSSIDTVDPSDVLDSLSEKSNGVDCPAEAVSNGRESNSEKTSNSDDIELRVSPGSTQELLNGSIDLESVITGSANDSEVDELLFSSEVEESQNEFADEDALLASPSREYDISEDVQDDYDKGGQDEEHGMNDVDNVCKEPEESKGLPKQECDDIGRSNSQCDRVSESEDSKPFIESSSSLSGDGDVGAKNGNTTNYQSDKYGSVAENGENDSSVESVNESLTRQSDTLKNVESEPQKENGEKDVDESDISDFVFEAAHKESGSDKSVTSPVRRTEDLSEEAGESSALMIDEASLDGSSMRLLDELTSSTNALLSRNNSRVACDSDDASISPCASRMEVDSLKVTEKELELESGRTSSETVRGHGILENIPAKLADNSAIAEALKEMTRKELEEAILGKVAQSIADKNEIMTLLEIVKKKNAELAVYERKYQTMYKQMSDLAVVFKRYAIDRKTNPQVAPAKVTRGVGVQVRIDAVQSSLANSTSQPSKLPTSQVAADPVQRKTRGHPVKQNNANPSSYVQRQTTPTKAAPPPLTPTSPRGAANRGVSATSRQPSTTPAASSPQVQSPSRPVPRNSPNKSGQMNGPRVATVTAPPALQTVPRQPNQSEVAGTSSNKIVAPMVAIPPEVVERASAASSSTLSARTETTGHQENIVSPRDLQQQHQTYTVRQTPVVAKVTLPSNVTQMLEAQAAAKRAAAAQRPAAPQGARQVADDVIDLTDEDDSSFSVVQRSSSISQAAKTVSSQIIQSDVPLRKNLTSASRGSTVSIQAPRGSTTSTQRSHGLSQHPAPLPPSPPNPRVALHLLPPPKPKVSLTKKGSGILITWNMDLLAQHADIKLYHIYVYQESQLPPSTSLWKYIGEIRALPLPMACTLKQFSTNHRYHFAVKAMDKFDRFGLFSDVVNIVLS